MIIEDMTIIISLKIEGLLRDANTVGESPTLALTKLAKINKVINKIFTFILKTDLTNKKKINKSHASKRSKERNGKL